MVHLTSEDQRRYEKFRERGFVLVEDALASFDLTAVSAAFEHARAETEDAWRAMVASGVYRGGYGHGPDAHSIEDPYRFDDLFLDLAENDRLAALLRAIIGPGMQVTEIFAHVHHAGTAAHTGWHRDWPPYRHPKYTLKAKVFYFLDDQREDMGCFSLVPGSHHRDPFPPHEEYAGERLETMPGMEKMVCPAGSALIWDVTLWHTATANVSEQDRRMLIYAYQPFFVKNWESRRPPDNVIAWADTPARRQLMGIHAVDGRAGWDRFDVDYLPEHAELAKAKII